LSQLISPLLRLNLLLLESLLLGAYSDLVLLLNIANLIDGVVKPYRLGNWRKFTEPLLHLNIVAAKHFQVLSLELGTLTAFHFDLI
jgi:hypothetical protein